MTDFLLKSTISLTVFLAFYHLVLEREKMHQFNRFYLLFSIIISLAIPFLTFEIIKIVPVVQNIEPQIDAFQPLEQNQIQEKINFIPYLILVLYSIVTFILMFRFGKNISKLITKSNSNPIVNYKNANLVLVDEKTLPHTFLKSIFINFDDYNNRNIEDELFTHELVHVTQKHTLDILFIEFLKAIFWFNPLFILYKKAIQLNHEFLADQEIVKTYNDVPLYQNLLLQKSCGNQTIYLASNLNYLVTKKRLIMMTKSTSKKTALLKKIAITPIFAGLIFLLCFKTVAQEKAISSEKKKSVQTKISPETKVVFKNSQGNVIVDKKYKDLTSEQKKQIPPAPPKKANSKSNLEKKEITIEVNDENAKKLVNYQAKADPSNAEASPDFPGGISEFYKYISKNYNIPKDLKTGGKVFAKFIVETNGKLSNIEVMRDPGFGTKEETIRVLENSPNWIAAKKDGIPVCVEYSIPINLQPKQ